MATQGGSRSDDLRVATRLRYRFASGFERSRCEWWSKLSETGLRFVESQEGGFSLGLVCRANQPHAEVKDIDVSNSGRMPTSHRGIPGARHIARDSERRYPLRSPRCVGGRLLEGGASVGCASVRQHRWPRLCHPPSDPVYRGCSGGIVGVSGG